MAKKNKTVGAAVNPEPDPGVVGSEGSDSNEAQPIRVNAPPITSKQKLASKSKAVIGGIKPVAMEDRNLETPDLPSSEHDLVEIFVDEELHINGQRLFGLVKVPIHQARSIIPMLQSKKRADVEVFTGRSFQVEKTLNNRLIIREINE